MSWWKCSAAQLLSSRWLSSTFGGESKERPSAKYFSRRPSLLQRLRSFPTSIKSQSDHLGNFVCSATRELLSLPNLGREPRESHRTFVADWLNFFVCMWALGTGEAYYPIFGLILGKVSKKGEKEIIFWSSFTKALFMLKYVLARWR